MQIFIEKKLSKLNDTFGHPLTFQLDQANKQINHELFNLYHQNEKCIKLTNAQLNLLSNLCLQGMKGIDLANKLGVTKQAVAQFVNDLEKKGLLEKKQDCVDTRAKIISHTKLGFSVVSELIDCSSKIEKKYSQKFGRKKLCSVQRNSR
jgi:DNA-binding MarR family transcriptional regulator